jgi:release factor glutamine methyltransferase
MKTVLEVLQATNSYFEKHTVESPRLNAEHLLGHVLAKKRLDLYMEFDRPLSETDLVPLRELVRRRAQGEPLQHLLGTAEFFGRSFLCDRRALIPRPETEQLVERILSDKTWKDGGAPRVLDVGCGSGVIALTLAAELPGARIQAFDISLDALALSRENAERLDLSERIEFFESDLLGAAQGYYDLIVANLPYIPRAEISRLSREVQFDPLLALDGGPGGFDLIDRLVVEATDFLRPGGTLAFEVGHDQATTLIDKLSKEGYHDIRAFPDYQEFQRFVIAHHG